MFYSPAKCRLYCLLIVCFHINANAQQGNSLLLQDMFLIDGNSSVPLKTNILIRDGMIAAIGNDIKADDTQVLNLSGKFVMPALISTHVHIGNLKGTTAKASNYTRENILSQLEKYQHYGVENILVMGTDQPMLFENGLRDSSANDLLPGARIYSAGFGFNVPPKPAPGGPMDHVFRPVNAAHVDAEIDTLAGLKIDIVKMWVDDFGGSSPKMQPEIYTAIINEAHKRNMRVASHLYYLSDARKLVAAGVDIIAHSIRDSLIDDALLQEMKAKHVAYIPTLSLDEFAYIYARRPDWIDDDFFKASLEPGVYEMITAPKFQDNIKNSPAYQKNIAAFEMALRNLKKIFDAGILVGLGTDSGANPVRAQGFSEHLELELMVQAGLTPLQAIGVATKNAAELMHISNRFGTLEKGKVADFIVLSANPLENIKNTRKIEAVYKAGIKVSGAVH